MVVGLLDCICYLLRDWFAIVFVVCLLWFVVACCDCCLGAMWAWWLDDCVGWLIGLALVLDLVIGYVTLLV